MSSLLEVEVGLSTLSSVCVRFVRSFYSAPPVLVSDVPEAWLRWSNHRRVKGTAFAYRQVNPHAFANFIHLSNRDCRTKLSKSLATDASKLEWRTAADLRIKFGVTLRTSTVRGLGFLLDVYSIDM